MSDMVNVALGSAESALESAEVSDYPYDFRQLQATLAIAYGVLAIARCLVAQRHVYGGGVCPDCGRSFTPSEVERNVGVCDKCWKQYDKEPEPASP